ncbi:MAG: tripartite tricarboxylate transporter permease, partial [Nanoarchaeota archaeon]|nr:tripartite tricarboxylate transporter permease [Nanoarchaeota archaeon]
KKWLKSLTVFLLAGCLGLIVLTGIPNLKQPLFPLLSGLFGFSILLVSLFDNSIIPKQNLSKPLTITKKNYLKSISAASGVGFIAAFLPGFGNSQAAIVATEVVGDVGDEGFLSLVGGINTANMLISIGTVYMLDKARNGAIVGVKKLLGTVGLQEMILFLGVALLVGGIATILAINISKVFAKYIVKVKYSHIVWSIIIFITILTFFFDGFIGLLILTTATAIGLTTSFWKVGKNHLMGCLILPVILFFVL